MKNLAKLAFVAIAVATFAGSALASEADKLFSGKVAGKAEIWLASKTRFSGFALYPGQYRLEYRVDGSDHTINFVRLRTNNSREATGRHRVMPVRVRCGIEPLPGRATQTTFFAIAEGDASRALKLEIKGERVAHIFPMPVSPESLP